MDTKSKLYFYHNRNRNSNNKWITVSYLEELFKKFQIDKKINDIELYKTAFVHENYLEPSDEQLSDELPLRTEELDKQWNSYIPFQSKSYERLEFLGDRVLDLIVCDYIYHRYGDKDDGFLSDLKTKMVRTETLSIFSKKLGFSQYIIISKKYETNRRDNEILEDVFEAFLGALYEDCGGDIGVCKKFIFHLIENYLDMSAIVRKDDNYKKQLMEFFHMRYKLDPKYVKISTYGPTYNRIFTAGVLNIDGTLITTGEGSTLKEAEQNAAKQALIYHGLEIYDVKNELDKTYYDKKV